MSASGFGERLKREREAKGISLEQISAQTRIGARLLRAIEEEDLKHLPGGLFNKSFLRQYARYLGLEDESFVQEYLRVLEPRRDVPAGEKAGISPADVLKPDSSWPPHWALETALAALVLVAIFYFVTRGRRPELPDTALSSPPSSEPVAAPRYPAKPPATPPEAKPESTAMQAASAPAAVPTAEQSSPAGQSSALAPARAPALVSAPVPAASVPPAGRGLVLQINALQTAWISVTADGNKTWEGTLQPNQSRQVEAADSIQVTLGNAGGVQMTLNGQPMGNLGREGQVRTITLAAREAPAAAP